MSQHSGKLISIEGGEGAEAGRPDGRQRRHVVAQQFIEQRFVVGPKVVERVVVHVHPAADPAVRVVLARQPRHLAEVDVAGQGAQQRGLADIGVADHGEFQRFSHDRSPASSTARSRRRAAPADAARCANRWPTHSDSCF